eukprot:gene20514-27305_t
MTAVSVIMTAVSVIVAAVSVIVTAISIIMSAVSVIVAAVSVIVLCHNLFFLDLSYECPRLPTKGCSGSKAFRPPEGRSAQSPGKFMVAPSQPAKHWLGYSFPSPEQTGCNSCASAQRLLWLQGLQASVHRALES